MESLVIFDVPLVRTGGPESELVIRATGRVVADGPEILLGYEALRHNDDAPSA